MYKHEISGSIRHHECDSRGEIKLHCLMDRMQDAAAEHAAMLKVGMDELAGMKLIWVLSRLQIHLDRPLTLGESLDVITYPSGVQRIFAHRCYDLRIGGIRAGYAGSFWLPVNTAAGRPVNAKKVLPPEIMDLPEVEKFFPEMDKLPEITAEICASYKVRAGDIDLNCHLNNAVYARWISDILGEKFNSDSIRITDIQLNYLASCISGEIVQLRCETGEEGSFAVCGEKEDGTAVFQAAGKVSL